MVKNKEELLELINKTSYPDFPFKPLPEVSESQSFYKEKEKLKRQEKYRNTKNFYSEDSDKKKERLEKERQFRKERYRKMKENK